ncbi:G2F domain [Desmophyllum pertusum]|uniref:G2F domain n=1 Tax=Desmophyllum pertusum TaxID=174260 RepID=A0A9X0CIM9_9CNID|nr:G2F domain [Desmophyllum pertusum]
MKVATQLFLLCTLCIFSAGGDSPPVFTAQPPSTFLAVEGHNSTLKWTYNFGNGSFRQLIFLRNFDILVDKIYNDVPPYATPAYVGRLLVNVTDTYASITFLGVKRTDSTDYALKIVSKKRQSADSLVEISVQFIPAVAIDGDQQQFVPVGNEILLTCRYNASPPASEVQWIKDGNVIATNGSLQISDSRVTIPHHNESQVQLSIINATTSQDAGNYTCLVINDVGNSSDTTSIFIKGVF